MSRWTVDRFIRLFWKTSVGQKNTTRGNGLICLVGHTSDMAVPPADSRGFIWEIACQAKTTMPSTLPPFVHGRLFGRFEPNLFTANHVDGGRFLVHNSGIHSVACRFVLERTWNATWWVYLADFYWSNEDFGQLSKNCLVLCRSHWSPRYSPDVLCVWRAPRLQQLGIISFPSSPRPPCAFRFFATATVSFWLHRMPKINE